MQELNRWFRDGRGLYVHVIRWEPETQRVIYLRKDYRISALVLWRNSGVILLSVKDHQHIDSAIPDVTPVSSGTYKAGAGIAEIVNGDVLHASVFFIVRICSS